MAPSRWRVVVNRGLSRMTGYKLVKATRPKPQPLPRRRRSPARPYDAEAQRIIGAVRPRTMTGDQKLFALIVATRHVADRGIPGAIVECGVWRGGSMQAVAYTLLERGKTDRDLHLYDTFEGMPPPGLQDLRHDGRSAAELLRTRAKTAKVWAVAGLEDVQEAMAETGYPAERVKFHPGRVEDT